MEDHMWVRKKKREKRKKKNEKQLITLCEALAKRASHHG
jgi:hypothetical protein